MGRPPLPKDEKRTERVVVNLTVGEREGLEEAAGEASLSDFFRAYANPDPPPSMQALRRTGDTTWPRE